MPRNLIRMAQSFGLPRLDIVRKILLPGAMPGILAGFRISASVALLLVVAAEMIGAEHGIGASVLTAGNLMQTDQLLAGVVMLSVLGLLIAWGLGGLERGAQVAVATKVSSSCSSGPRASCSLMLMSEQDARGAGSMMTRTQAVGRRHRARRQELLQHLGDAEQLGLAPALAGELQADRQALLREAAGSTIDGWPVRLARKL